MAKKTIDKQKTIQSILDWGNRSIGHGINTQKLNEAMAKPDWETTLIKMAEFCGVSVIYK